MPIYKMSDKNGKLIKKDGKQKYRIIVSYTDSYGKHRQMERKAFGNDEAKQVERELALKLQQKSIATTKFTLKELYNDYINSKKNEVRETTLDKSKRMLKRYVITEDFCKTKIENINIQWLQKWKQFIEDKSLSIRTRKNIYSEFRTMLNYAVKMEYLPTNPILKIGNFKAPLELQEEMQYYTPEEFIKYISAARKSEQWNYYVFFNIAFYMGMRKGEINALQWTDIKGNYISITKSIAQKLKGEDRITPPKNRSSVREIEIPKPLIDVLDEHYKRCQSIEGFNDSFLICGGLKALRDSTLQNMNKHFAKEAGVKYIRIHDFRHSHASLLANEGINIQEIARRLGHSNANITLKTYSHLYPRENERAITILNKITV